jgi:ABC-type microcin C transport system permease subunit YejB
MAGIGHNQKPTVNISSLNETERKRLKNALMEMNDSLTRVAAERDLQKETINSLYEELGVDKKLVRRMAKAYFKANFGEEVEENKAFEESYDLIIKNTVP